MKAGMLTLMLALTPALAFAAPVEAVFQGTTDESPGRATLTPTRSGVLFELSLTGMPPSTWLSVHVHENDVCDPAGGHDAAGGHFNPGKTEHGWLSETGPHAGDMPNIWSDASGAVEAQIHNPLVTWETGEASIQNRALIIHAKGDDYQSQPSGDAGARLACAVIPQATTEN